MEKVTLFPQSIKEMTDCTNIIITQKATGTAHQKQSLWEKKSESPNLEQNWKKNYYRTSLSRAQVNWVENAFKKTKANQLQHQLKLPLVGNCACQLELTTFREAAAVAF